MKIKAERIWELDFFRGVALILMVYFHTIYDLKEIFGFSVSYASGINFYLGRAAGILFIFLSGISSNITGSNFKRGIKLLVLALLITLITHLYDPAMGIKFGILHFLGISILTAPYIIKLNEKVLFVLGTAVIILNIFVSGIVVGQDSLFIFGLVSDSFVSSDYYPLIPWYGIFLYGLACGKILYKNKKSRLRIKSENILTMAGRRTLLIYLLHQPVIILLLTILTSLTARQ